MPRYSETVIDHVQSPRNYGQLKTPDVVGLAGVPGRGRYLVLHLKIDDGRVADAKFQCHGCGATIAAGSLLTEMICGLSLEECRRITASELLAALEGLPPDKRHCAGFAVSALQQALDDYHSGSESRSPK